ncbi:hypothetical protein KAT51_03110 [bacterium]|nr:hypothetical protein [bacterium]
MKVGLFSLLLLLFLTNPLCALQKGDLVFRSLPSPMLSWIPDHVAISVDGAFRLIAAERNHMKEQGKKMKYDRVEYTDLRDHYWVTYGRVRKTSILESSPAFKELSQAEQEEIREAIVQFAVKRYGEKFDYPFDGIDDDPHTWYCSEFTRAAYEAALAPFIGRPGKVSNLSSPSHRIALPSKERIIQVTWTPARDRASLKGEIALPYTAWGQYSYTPEPDPQKGIAGYSIAWDHAPLTLPDTTRDIEGKVNQIFSPPLKRGTWYFHIRSLDRAGYWSEEAALLGPFKIK